MDKFLLLRDRTGVIQLRLPADHELGGLPLESVIAVRGTVRRRPDGQENARMATGQLEVEVTQVQAVHPAKSSLPFQQNERILPKVRHIDISSQNFNSNLSTEPNGANTFKLEFAIFSYAGFRSQISANRENT
jgi:aspartyl-tRNA synthetase